MPASISKFVSMLRGRHSAVADAAIHAVDEFGEQVIGDAQQLTPVDTGALQASGTTEPAELDGHVVKKEIGFNTDYAAAVHENLNAHHDVGQAKYLETAMKEDQKKFNPFMEKRIKAAMEGGGGE